MNFEKIINYFRRLGKVFREKFAGLNFKKRDKSLKVRKAGIRSKWNRKQAEKSPEDRVTVLDMADVFLKTLKLLSDFFYVVIIVLTLFGAGLGLGYLGSQIQSVPLIKDKTLLNQIGEVSLVSSMSYSDSKKIADIDTDLLELLLKVMQFLIMLKMPLLLLRMKISISIRGLYQKLSLEPWYPQSWG